MGGTKALESEGRTADDGMHLMNRMKSGAHAFAIATLGLTLTFGVFACPLWMSLNGECKMPCPKGAASHCPPTVCQLSSPYLGSPNSIPVLVLRIIPAEHVYVPLLSRSTATRELTLSDDSGPPGHLGSIFLDTHSLRI